MKKKILAFVAGVPLLAAQAASAQILEPDGNWTFQGTVMVTGLGAGPFPCTMNVSILVPDNSPHPPLSGHPAGPHGHGVTSVDLDVIAGDPRCGLVGIRSNPHSATVAQTGLDTIITLQDVDLGTISIGGCFGDVALKFEDSPDLLKVDALVPEYSPGTGVCKIVGSASLFSPVDVSVTF